MSDARGGGRAAALLLPFVFFWAAPGTAAAESGDRQGAVLLARVELQRQLGDWLTRSLAGPAEPYRVDAAVRLEMRGVVREVRAKQQNVTPSVKIGAKNKVKLPGLGMVEGGGGQTALMPEINIDGGARVSETVSRQLETEVARMTVLLFVDPAMPKDRRALIVRLATDLAGVDRGRGDEVIVDERPPTPVSATNVVLAQTAEGSLARRGLPWTVLAACVTAIVAATILAVGLARGGRQRTSLAVSERGGGADGRAAPGAVTAEASAAAAAERKRRREETGAFAALAGATPKELVQVVAESDPHTATAIVDLFGLDDEAARLLEETVPAERRLEIGVGLATARTLSREQLGHLEAIAESVLQKVRSRVSLGGPARLAGFLAQAPARIRREVLDAVAARDGLAAKAARESLVLFEDLPRLADASVRQIVTSIDPGTVALALVGAPEVREVVLNAVSKRLRSILEVEEEVVKDRPLGEVDEARRAFEETMRALGGRGELRIRAAVA